MNEQTIFSKISDWIRNSVMLKLLTITILMLLLLIPVSMVQSIIDERESLNKSATEEVSSRWAGSQKINGPILSIPVTYVYQKDEELLEVVKNLYILPEKLEITGTISPETLKRGIYEVVVYHSDLKIKGSFLLNHKIDQDNLKAIRYDEAFLTMGISDLRGIKENLQFSWGDDQLKVNPGSKIPGMVASGVTIHLPDLSNSLHKVIPFNLSLKLQGSQQMTFVPLGSTTNVKITSPWNSPSFTGNFLPDDRSVSEEGFTANWQVLQLNRNFPQFWMETDQNLSQAAFGVDLLLPLDDYQKSMRSAKYGVMTIALTFLVFFLVEIMNKKKIHPFQYALVGLALSLFYILLVSITEHLNFNLAYTISTLAIVSMITLYSMSIFQVRKLTMLLAVTLIGIYGFLFVTLQLADYALLLGSVGLTIILALTMYFTRKVDWYQHAGMQEKAFQ